MHTIHRSVPPATWYFVYSMASQYRMSYSDKLRGSQNDCPALYYIDFENYSRNGTIGTELFLVEELQGTGEEILLEHTSTF